MLACDSFPPEGICTILAVQGSFSSHILTSSHYVAIETYLEFLQKKYSRYLQPINSQSNAQFNLTIVILTQTYHYVNKRKLMIKISKTYEDEFENVLEKLMWVLANVTPASD